MKINWNKVADAIAQTGLRRYIVKRFQINPPKRDKANELHAFKQKMDNFINILNTTDYLDVWSHMTEDEKEKAISLSNKYSKYISMINYDNLMLWLMRDAPVVYATIRAHPNGERWLNNTISMFLKNLYGLDLEVESEGRSQK